MLIYRDDGDTTKKSVHKKYDHVYIVLKLLFLFTQYSWLVLHVATPSYSLLGTGPSSTVSLNKSPRKFNKKCLLQLSDSTYFVSLNIGR